MNIQVKKIDGSLEAFNADRINQAIARACVGLDNTVAKTTQIASEMMLTLYNGISTAELDQAAINTAAQNIKDDPDFDKIAARLFLKTVYKEVLGDYRDEQELNRKHREGFISYITQQSLVGLLDGRMAHLFDLAKLADALDLSADELLTYTGASTMAKRYLIKNAEQKLLEIPQYFWMRVAMGLSLTEKQPTETAIKFYAKMSRLKYLPGGSTNINAGTATPRLSNCFLMDMEDSIEHIGKTVSDVMKLSKATGGVGLNVSRLRASGSPISTNNTFSSGPIPFLHIIDSTIRAISRAGKKMGALCFYMENWHLDFEEFLDLKQNAGDEYRRTRTANTAVYISDEFMKRVKAQDDWYLFDPKETPDLTELYGQNFSRRYQEYCRLADDGKMRIFKKVKASELFRKIIVSLQSTSHPWLTWKDTINVRAMNNNTGTIHCSNLCTEITLPQDKNNISVCNLLSINLARHITDGQINWEEFKDSIQTGLRQLDNLVDINQPPIPEASNFDSANRAVGLGLMGLADTFEQLGLAYDSVSAYELADEIFEFFSYHSIQTSAELAQEKGAYKNFHGSRWSQGILPIDTVNDLEESRGSALTVNKNGKLNWETLRSKVRSGVRNSVSMAIAPTANIGLVAGTSPGIDPRFAQIFSRHTLSGKYLEINFNLVKDLKKLNLWESVKDQLLLNYGATTDIEVVPDNLKNTYKDSFSVNPLAFIEVAARAQKWIDQALSRNMYLATRDTEEIMRIYMAAWEKGLKTTYYLHMKPRHKAEQSTTQVNKSLSVGKIGFGAVAKTTPPDAPIKDNCPIDPMERLQCDSCQ